MHGIHSYSVLSYNMSRLKMCGHFRFSFHNDMFMAWVSGSSVQSLYVINMMYYSNLKSASIKF